MKIGQLVEIAPNKSTLDCCQGKRGRIRFAAKGGGWLLNTNHFCPIVRDENELTIVPLEVQAQEHLNTKDQKIIERYEAAGLDMLKEYADRDKTAWAILILRGEIA